MEGFCIDSHICSKMKWLATYYNLHDQIGFSPDSIHMYVPVVPSFDCHTIVLCTEQELIQIFSLYLIIVISKYINYNTAVTRFRKTYLGFLQDCYKIPQDLARSCRNARKKDFSWNFNLEHFYWPVSIYWPISMPLL